MTIAAAQERTKPEAITVTTTYFHTLDIQTRSTVSIISLVGPTNRTSLVGDSDRRESETEGTDDESGDESGGEEPKFIDLDRQDTQVRTMLDPKNS